jgi:MGT family glycosyltransferase
MAKVLVVCTSGLGIIHANLPLTAELVRRGHDVHYAVPRGFEDVVAPTGATLRPYDSLWGRTKHDAGRLHVDLMQEAVHVMGRLRMWMRAERPDLVLYDSSSLAGRFLAESLRIPAVQLVATYASNEHFSLGDVFPVATAPPPVAAAFDAAMRELEFGYGVRTIAPKQVFEHAEDLNLVFLPKRFQVRSDTFDERFLFTGPNIAPRPDAARRTLPPDPGPRLYVSLGAHGSAWPRFFGMCFEAFADTAWQVFVSTSSHLDPASLGPAPANVTVRSHASQLELLRRVDAFVTHAGMSSTLESLHFGVPMVAIPLTDDQAITARQIDAKNLGRALTPDATTKETLRTAVETVASDASIRANVRAMQAEVWRAGGAPMGAAAVDAFMAHRARPREAGGVRR